MITARLIINFEPPEIGINPGLVYADGGYRKENACVPSKKKGETLTLSLGEFRDHPVNLTFKVVSVLQRPGKPSYRLCGVMPEAQRQALHAMFIDRGFVRVPDLEGK